MLVVLSEETRNTAYLNIQETRAITEAAKMFGCRVYHIPPDFEQCETAENALAYVPTFDPPLAGIWVGYIPTVERYTAIYDAARAKGVHLVNTPQQYQTAMEFDHFYPLLGDLTPQSAVIRSVDEWAAVGAKLGYPLFVKGAVKSNKEGGWKACVAENETELVALAESVLARTNRSRGRVIVRQLAKLRYTELAPNGFPLGREYRAFVYRGDVLAYGYYWDEYEDSIKLTPSDEREMLAVVREAARRVNVPYLAVDIGQLDSGAWIVIEVGDAQFCGLSHIPILELWSKLKDITLTE